MVCFLLNKTTENDLVAASSSSNVMEERGQRCALWFYSGMKHLLAGNKVAAAECFRKSMATKAIEWSEYCFARAELKALGQ
jgi:lipoprotein NlpI